MDTDDHVVKDCSATERKDLPILVDDSADAVEMVVIEGLLVAPGEFHTRV